MARSQARKLAFMHRPYAQQILYFFCYECRADELKSSPHYRNQKRYFARGRKAEQTQTAQQQTEN